MTHIFLHVGMMKTGTTAMQDWFAAHRLALRQHGLHYLVTGRDGRSACGNLADALYAHSAHLPKQLRAVRAEIDREAAAKVLISAEAFSYYGLSILSPLIDLLKPYPITLLIWLRRQDRYAEALFKQQVKFNLNTLSPQQFFSDALIARLDYHAMLQAFAARYPQITLAPKIYDEAEAGRVPDSIRAMLETLGLGAAVPADSATRRSNLTPHGDMVRLYNSLPRTAGQALRRANRQLLREFGDQAMGKDDLIPPAFAERLMQQLAASNAALKARYFPHRPQLFAPTGRTKGPQTDLAPEVIARFHQLLGDNSGG